MSWSIVAVAAALSADSFGVGLAYGMRGTRFPFSSIVAISVCSSVAVLLSIGVGRLLTGVVDAGTAGRLGGVILIGLGVWTMLEGCLRPSRRSQRGTSSGSSVVKVHIRSLGVAIHVFREPEAADLDASGRIEWKESILLGAALALDALAAGLAVSMVGIGYVLVPFVGLGNMALLPLGIWLGAKRLDPVLGTAGSFVPGALLVVLGAFKL